jgi:hypothetical protein
MYTVVFYHRTAAQIFYGALGESIHQRLRGAKSANGTVTSVMLVTISHLFALIIFQESVVGPES